MKAIILILFTALIPTLANACMCGVYPLDPQQAIEQTARITADGGRSTRIDLENGITLTKVYPTAFDRAHVDPNHRTSCTLTGPNGELTHYCAPETDAEYAVKVKTFREECVVTVRAKSALQSMSAELVKSTCHPSKN